MITAVKSCLGYYVCLFVCLFAWLLAVTEGPGTQCLQGCGLCDACLLSQPHPGVSSLSCLISAAPGAGNIGNHCVLGRVETSLPTE